MQTTITWHPMSEPPTRDCERGYVVITQDNYVAHLLLNCTTPEGLQRATAAWDIRYWAYADEIINDKTLNNEQDNCSPINEEEAYCQVIDYCNCGNCPRTDDCQLALPRMCQKGIDFLNGYMRLVKLIKNNEQNE